MNRSNRVFLGEPTTFEKAYPQLEDAVIEYEESGAGISEWSKGKQKASLKQIGGLIRCSNPLCKRGGFEIDINIIGHMLRNNELIKEGILRCPGDEGSPKGRIRGRYCINHIKYKMTLNYKSQV